MRKRERLTFEVFMSSREYVLLRHLIIQTMLFILSLNAFGTSTQTFVFDTDRLPLWATFYGMLNVVCYVNMYLLVPYLFMRNKIYKYALCIFIEVAVFLFLLIISQPSSSLGEIFPSNIAMIVTNLLASFINICVVVISTTTLMLFHYWTMEQRNVRELEVATRNAELEFLKSQINPHFLFNTLNNANALLRNRAGEASVVLFKLEDLIRYQMEECSKEYVLLDKDIQFLNDYLNLEKIRRDSFDFTCSINGKSEGVTIPPLLFIPFVENAVKYNPDSGARVDICFTINKTNLIFVCDNMKSQNYVKSPVGGIGLSNIRRRLELLYPEKHKLDIIDKDDSYRIVLTIDNIIKKG